MFMNMSDTDLQLLKRYTRQRAEDAFTDTPLSAAPLHTVSLAIAQKCNLGCAYREREAGSTSFA